MTRASFVLPGDARISIAVPEGAREMPEAALPAIDVSALPGAAVVLRRGWSATDLEARLACVTGPSTHHAPGIEDLVLDRASAMARALAPGLAGMGPWAAGPIERIDGRIEQRLHGAAGEGRAVIAAHAKHVLGFVGEARDGVICTATCSEPRGGTACAQIVDGLALGGPLVEPPRPSLVVQALLVAAEHPRGAGAIAAALALAAAALAIARRPRPRA